MMYSVVIGKQILNSETKFFGYRKNSLKKGVTVVLGILYQRQRWLKLNIA